MGPLGGLLRCFGDDAGASRFVMSNATSGDVQAMIGSVEIRCPSCEVVEICDPIYEPMRNGDVALNRFCRGGVGKTEPEKLLDIVRVQVDEFNAYSVFRPGGEDRQASSRQALSIALDDARKEMIIGANDNALKMAVEAHVDSIHAAVVAALASRRGKGFSSFQVTVVEEFD